VTGHRGITDRGDRRSIRLPNYDYSQAGVYFVTICTVGRQPLLSTIVDLGVVLTSLGSLVKETWEAIPRHVAGVELDSYVIMPNHLHGLIALPDRGRGTACRAPTRSQVEAFGHPTTQSLPTVIRSFKAAVSRQAGLTLQRGRIWQRGFYERVIRDEAELEAVRSYIAANPVAWENDEYRARS
jgi:REP element-mobilizing transposase RayT